MNVAIVILNWNGRALLERFLPIVVKHSSDEAQVYVADNASTDTSVAYCKTAFPEDVIVIQNTVNGGYAKGYNDALKHITADVFVLLNSDIEVTNGWLTPIIEQFKANPNLAAAQPKIRDLKNRTYFEYAGAAGGYIDVLGYPYCRGRVFDTLEKDSGQYDDTVAIHWASGACFFVRAQAYKEIGGLDEDYFAHQEEIDLCWRLLHKGYEVKAIGSSSVFHLGGATLAKANPQKTYYNFRNSLFNIVKHVPSSRYILYIFFRLLLDGIAAFQFLLKGKPKHLWAILRAHLSFYTHLPLMIKKRNGLSKKSLTYPVTSILFTYYVQSKRLFNEYL